MSRGRTSLIGSATSTTATATATPTWGDRCDGSVVRLDAGLDTAHDDAPEFSTYGEVVNSDGDSASLCVPRSAAAAITARLLAEQPVVDLTIEDPPIDDVIERVFAFELPDQEPNPKPEPADD